MPATIPPDAIFCDDAGVLFLVVNWRARRERVRPAQLLKLSERHVVQLREMRARGRSDLAIHNVLFLPKVRCEQLLVAPAPISAVVGDTANTTGPSGMSPAAPAVAAPKRRAVSISWGISGMLHVIALCVCCSIAWLMPLPDVPLPTAPQGRLAPPSGPPAEVAQIKASTELAEPVTSDDQTITDLITPLDVAEDTTVDETVDASRPRPDILGVLSKDAPPGRALFISSRTKTAGAFGPHGWQHRAAALSAFGGNEASQNAVDAALRWLKRTQCPAGCWDIDGDPGRCQGGQAPQREDRLFPGGQSTVLTAMTGSALLCFLGAGYDQNTPSRYRSVVHAGLEWLLAHQRLDGYLGENNYSNGIATMALCEALDASHDVNVRAAAQRAVKAILAHQNRVAGPDGVEVGYGQRSGWDYVGPSTRDDSSVTGWNLMALVSARKAGLDVGNGLDGVRDWFDSTWKATNVDIGVPGAKAGESRFPYVHVMETQMTVLGPPNGSGCDLAGVGAVAAAFVPHGDSDHSLVTLANYIERVQLPSRGIFNRYYVYYNSLAMFQLGDRYWARWNRAMREQLIASQRRDRGCVEGSWEDGLGGFCRTFSTALCCLSLEVYYRYDRVQASR